MPCASIRWEAPWIQASHLGMINKLPNFVISTLDTFCTNLCATWRLFDRDDRWIDEIPIRRTALSGPHAVGDDLEGMAFAG